jgi:hypothetical protein
MIRCGGISEGNAVPDEVDVRWVSYAELAEARGIDRLSAVRTARNRRWEKRKGNDGTIWVAVPRNFLENAKHREKENPQEVPGEISPEISRKISALEAKVELLDGQLEREREQVRELTEQVAVLREGRAAAIVKAEAHQAEGERLWQRIAELEARLAERSEPPATASEAPDPDAISADLEHEGLPLPAWVEEAWGAENSSDQSATADPAHQVERLWQRIEELEHRVEEARTVDTSDEGQPAAAGDPPAEPPRRWWRRLLRR